MDDECRRLGYWSLIAFLRNLRKKVLSGFERLYFTFSLFLHVKFYKMREIFTLHTDVIDTLQIVINTSFIGRSHDWGKLIQLEFAMRVQ